MTSTTTTGAPGDLGQQYLAIRTPVSTTSFTFNQQLSALGDSATGADLARIAAPVIAALNEADQALQRVAWPGRVRADISALVADDAVFVADLSAAGSQTPQTIGSWKTQLFADVKRDNLAASKVAADLGLSASPS
jgi:hypothetical protein